MSIITIVLSLFLGSTVHAHVIATEPQTILVDLSSAKAAGATVLSQDSEMNLAVAYATPEQMSKISNYGHTQRKCAGFEVLSGEEVSQPGFVLNQLRVTQAQMYFVSPMNTASNVVYNQSYKDIIDQASANELKNTITWLSSYKTRVHTGTTANQHVEDLKNKLEEWLKDAPWKYTIERVKHTTTKQDSLKLTITGSTKPSEVVVLGGHLDSINQGLLGLPMPLPGFDLAPGADDNASGSSNLIEALKLLKKYPKFDRTLEFYWYAGEEGGLLGSAEIAKSSKSGNRNIIGVLQLDMTLFPGSGEQVVGLMTDFTSPWLRSVLTQINDIYIKSRFVESQCGYGCSDHASWNRQGFHAVTPFEATMQKMNSKIHTKNDVINSQSSFTHSNTFTKYAVLFALVLGNSDLKAP